MGISRAMADAPSPLRLEHRAGYVVLPVFASAAKQSSLGATGLPRFARKDDSDNRHSALNSFLIKSRASPARGEEAQIPCGEAIHSKQDASIELPRPAC